MSNLRHVHIYEVIGLAEVEVEDNDDPTVVMEKALKKSGKVEYKQPDCRYIAMIPRPDVGTLTDQPEAPPEPEQ